MTTEELEKFIDQKVAEIGEHVEAVQILVAWNIDGKTMSIKRVGGLWHARQGLAHEFINEDIAQDQARQIGYQINPPRPSSDGDDDWKNAV